MKIAIGFGDNRFTMSRGSFRYRQKIREKRYLKLIERQEIDQTNFLVYQDVKSQSNYKFRVQETEGRLIVKLQDDLPDSVNRVWITLPTNPTERIYGCGETYSKFNLKGEKVRVWVAEHQNASRITKKIIKEKLIGKHPNKRLPFQKYESYYAQPTFTSSNRYYVHANVSSYFEFDFSKPDEITMYFQEKPSFVTETADSFEELSEKLSSLLGRQKRLPDWIYNGSILAVQGGTDVIDNKIQKASDAGVKINGIWSQDWCGCRKTGFGYQVMWNWEWDQLLYPKLDTKIQEWKSKGIRFLGYINPFIAIEKDLYQTASKNGYCVKNKDGQDYLVTITTFPAAMIDFTNPRAYEWYKNLIKANLIGLGMSGWMADFGEYLPVDSVLFSGENPAAIHNQWPAIWAKMNQEAIEECGLTDDIFFFTRAGYTESIRTSAMMWTGDQHVDWSVDDGLPSVIPATLSLAMSGYGITHSDAGGYTTIMQMRRTKELLMRWIEMNAFSPLLRTHEGNQPVNNVQFDDDDEILAQMARCSTMHQGLKQYLQDCVEEQETKGIPVMRPLFFYYDEDEAYDEMTEYLLGRDILVAPVIKEGTNRRSCYLPKDRWVHLFTGKEYQGGKVEIDAPIGKPPVFIRKGSKNYEGLRKLEGLQYEGETETRK